MKRIWIDGYEANIAQRVGSGQVAFELIKNIEKLDFKNFYTVLLPSPPLADLPSSRDGFEYKVLKHRQLWTRIALPIAIFRAQIKPDVFFSPTHYLPLFNRIKKVMMIMDLGYIHYPQFFKKSDLYKLNNWTKQSIKLAAKIIAISKATKKDIIDHYKVSAEKIFVAYPGKDEKLFRPNLDKDKINRTKARYRIDTDYIIFISTLQPRKNVLRLIEAFEKINNLKLVIVGKTKGEGREGWMYEEILEKPKNLGIEDKVIFTGFVPNEDLPYLISGAVAYIQPSLWEGFGIPALEAMACGTPPLVSDVSSLPEVVGEAGLKFDPISITQIEQAIRLISTDKKLRQKLVKKSLEQAKKFSWDKMAKEVIKILEEI